MPSVKELIEQRKKEISTPGERRDPFRLALVIEGGAMRGVVSAAMISALEELELREVFDDVWATSVGAITGAYFIAGQAQLRTTTYLEDIALKRADFLPWKRRCLGQFAMKDCCC